MLTSSLVTLIFSKILKNLIFSTVNEEIQKEIAMGNTGYKSGQKLISGTCEELAT